ncbi:MAG TPA: RNA-binding S4 domain-containing protein [Clostridiales bacterium]|nr:RNA-binding S4 domain-containing protein [Clostridiales bacterium]
MRLDKYLKVSRIIKRRTVANEVSSQGRIQINGRVAKPSSEVKPGDIIAIQFGDRIRQYEVLAVDEHVTKENAVHMYREL